MMMIQYDDGEPVRFEDREREIAVRAGMSLGRARAAISHLRSVGKLEPRGQGLSIRAPNENLTRSSEDLRKTAKILRKAETPTARNGRKNVAKSIAMKADRLSGRLAKT